MRKINNIVVHCTATPQTATVDSIKKYWKEVKGWKSVGYHFLIKPSGEVVKLAPIDQITNGVMGHNSDSIHISYIGGVDAKGKALDNRTHEQKESIKEVVLSLLGLFPEAEVKGHRDFAGVKKDCPSFDVGKWFRSL